MSSIMNFLNMGGYAFYVWTAYGSVLTFLFVQWFIQWRRWQRYINE